MAKKKRRRLTRSPSIGTGAGAPTTTTRGGVTDPTTVKPEPASPGGPNRQARKQEARQRREALRRRMTRRRFYRRVAWVLAVLVVAAAVTGYTLYQRRATARAIEAAGCGAVQTIQPYDPPTQDTTHISLEGEVIEPPPLSTYPSSPPVSGPHLPPGQQVPSGVYPNPPDVYGTIHSLEHGAVVIWYDPRAPVAELNEVREFFDDPGEREHVIVAPYSYPDQGESGTLPQGRMMALTAWHHVQYCGQPSLAAARAFIDDYRAAIPNPPGYRGDAPEAGASV